MRVSSGGDSNCIQAIGLKVTVEHFGPIVVFAVSLLRESFLSNVATLTHWPCYFPDPIR